MIAVALWLIFGVICVVSIVVVLQLGLIAFHLGDIKAYIRTVIHYQQQARNAEPTPLAMGGAIPPGVSG